MFRWNVPGGMFQVESFSVEEPLSELCHPFPLSFDQGLALGPAIGRGSRGMDIAVVIQSKRRQRSILFIPPGDYPATIDRSTCECLAIELDLVPDGLVGQEDQGHRAERGVESTDGLEEAAGLERRLVFDAQVDQSRQDMLGIAYLTCLEDTGVQRDTGVVMR